MEYKFTFTSSDRADIKTLLEESSVYSRCDTDVFIENLLEVTQDMEFAVMLRQLLNKATSIDDITVNGTSLSEIVGEFENERLGVLVALPLLYLEKQNEDYKYISRIASKTVYADKAMLKNGEAPTILVKTGIGWFAANDETYEKNVYDEDLFVEAPMWPLMLAEPLLIPHMMIGYPDETQIFINEEEEGERVAVYIPHDAKWGDE